MQVVAFGSGLYEPGTFDLYFFDGEYPAGTVSVAGGRGTDLAQNVIGVPGGSALATVFLTYQENVSVAIRGAGSVEPGQTTTLLGEYYESTFLPPIDYQWYQGGTQVSGETGATFQAQGGAPNTPTYYEFRVTDSQGRTVSAGHTVMTTAGCGSQLECE